MNRRDFIKAYMHGWHDHGRVNGIYLWDVELSELDKSVTALAEEAANVQYETMQKKKCSICEQPLSVPSWKYCNKCGNKKPWKSKNSNKEQVV